MARTIAEIEAQIIQQKEQNPNFSGLTSTSLSAIWRLQIYIIANAIWIHEKLFDIFKAEIQEIEKAVTPYTLEWWQKKVLAFQYGHSLVNGDEYSVIDETTQIIKQSAVNEGINILTIKIATEDASGELVKIIDPSKVVAFQAYVDAIGVAGQFIDVVNENADQLTVNLDVYYDASKLDDSGASISLGDGVNQVEKALNLYLKSLGFNGKLIINHLIDYLQKVDGIKDVHNLEAFYTTATTPLTQINRVYYPASGYMVLNALNINFYVES